MLLSRLTERELQDLFPEMVIGASFAHGAIEHYRHVIVSLPRDWVLAHIDEAAESVLKDATSDEYRRLLELYRELNDTLALRLALRAAASPDPEAREVGEEFATRIAT